MKKIFLSWQNVENYCQEIIRQITKDSWRPDYIVGIGRGGLTPAVLISQYLGVKMISLDVSLRDGGDTVSNCSLASDAFGYSDYDPMASGDGRKQILIVDDINDSGATLNWIKEDWKSSCLPYDPRWIDEIWGHNVRVAVLYDNESSKSKLDITYSAVTINKADEDCWIIFPWEDWWKN
jgi:hypoxanthine phosphoribosyltransferase